jgi:hypothetical protein
MVFLLQKIHCTTTHQTAVYLLGQTNVCDTLIDRAYLQPPPWLITARM